MKGTKIGEFEEFVLLGVCQLGEEAHSVNILEVLEKVAERRSSLGAIYAALDRLERKGMVTSWIGQSEAGRVGRPKRHFKATEKGIQELDRLETIRTRMRRLIRERGQEAG